MKVIGIDLGTANTVISVKGKGIMLREPSVVAVDAKTKKVVAVGRDARLMLGKTPGSIIAMRPLKEGVIAEFDVTAQMLNHYFKRVSGNTLFSRPRVVICIPYGVTEVAKRAVEDVTLEAGAQAVSLIEEPIAAALGAGLKISEARGSMIVDIGAGTTEVAVLSLGGIVISKSIRTAGDILDATITDYIKHWAGVLISDSASETLKKKIGTVNPQVDLGTMEVRGRNLLSGLPETVTLSTGDIYHAMIGKAGEIVTAVIKALEDTPPELASDIFDTGIMLAGGGAMLNGLDQLITAETGIRTFVARNPIDCVARGIGKVIDNDSGKIINYRAR